MSSQEGSAAAVGSSPEAARLATPATGDLALSDSSRKRVRDVLLTGFIASLLLMIGSYGIGWMASSSPLIRTQFFILARTTPVAVVLCTVITCVGGLLLLRAWLQLGQLANFGDSSHRRVFRRALLLWSGPMMLSLPLFSRDSYAYIGQGRLMQQGLDPYVDGISSLNNYFNLGPDTLWTEAPTPYGPVWLWLEHAAVAVANGSPELTLIPFRLACLLGVVLLAVYLPRIGEHFGFNGDRIVWLAVLNPVLLINFIASVHNDSLMLGLAIAGLYYAATKKSFAGILLGIVLVTLSVAIKPITLIALPFVGLLWAGNQAGWVKKFSCWAATLGIFLALMLGMATINGLGFGWLGALQTPGTVWIWYAPFGLFANGLGFLVNLGGGPGTGLTSVIEKIAQVGSILVVLVLMFVPVKSRQTVRSDLGGGELKLSADAGYSYAVLRRMTWAFSAVVLMAPMIQPWYMCWLLAFFAMTGIKPGVQTRIVYFGTLFFLAIALTDQISVYQWIPMALIRTVAILCSVLGAAWFLFGDKTVRDLFSKKQFS